MKKNLFLLSFIIILASCADEFGTSSSPVSDFESDTGIIEVEGADGETYNVIEENDFVATSEEPTSTFSIDADGGSYANIRSQINSGQEVNKSSVRTEEIINYFQYDYQDNNPNHPISLNGEIASSPWSDNKLLRIGIKGKEIKYEELPPSNLVLLIDVSGSMNGADKLPLLKSAFKKLVDNLKDQDKLAIVTYASNAGVHLESTSCSEKSKIKDAIDDLSSGGGTYGSGGIEKAYDIAAENFMESGNNRVIVASDGDFNIGITNHDALLELIEDKRENGIFLTTIGVGRGNFNDANMEQIANHGNGTYEYIDNMSQAEKVFVHEFSKFFTVAKDVKVQVNFNPRMVDAYRLIGYENRVLNNEDFEDDTKDAGEIGAGQTITAIYEIIPANLEYDPLIEETFNIEFRYKMPDEDQSQLITLSIKDQLLEFEESTEDMRFASAMAALGMHLFNSKHKGEIEMSKIREWVSNADSFDPFGDKEELKTFLNYIK